MQNTCYRWNWNWNLLNRTAKRSRTWKKRQNCGSNRPRVKTSIWHSTTASTSTFRALSRARSSVSMLVYLPAMSIAVSTRSAWVWCRTRWNSSVFMKRIRQPFCGYLKWLNHSHLSNRSTWGDYEKKSEENRIFFSKDFASLLFSISGVDDVIRQCGDFLTVALGLCERGTPFMFTGCRHGNLLLTGATDSSRRLVSMWAWSSLLFHCAGSRGSGRTSVARHLCRQLDGPPHYVHSMYLECSSLKGRKIEALQREWQSLFQELVDKQPSVLILDDLDLLAGYPQNDHDDSLNGENWYSTR